MGGQNERIRRRHYRRRLRRSSRGVVSVIGTLLALLVFFALFGIFLTQYVPLWMTENEQQLSVQTQAAMAQLKSNVDLQVALGSPPVYSAPFPTVSQSIPLLSQPTSSTITFVPFTVGSYGSVTLCPGPGNPTCTAPNTYNQTVNLGRLTVQLPDRYYSPQTFSLEDDAVVQSQASTQQVVEYPPLLAFNQSGAAYGVTVSLIQLVGTSAQSVATGTQEVYSHFVFTQVVQSSSSSNALSVTYVVGTQYPSAWYSFLNTALSQSNLTSAQYTLTCLAHSTSVACSAAQAVKLSFTGLAYATLVFSEVRIVVGVGVE